MAKLLFNRSEHPEITFDDVFLVPTNALEDQVLEKASDAEKKELQRMKEGVGNSSNTELMKKKKKLRARIMALADQYNVGNGVSRDDVDLTPNGNLAKTPIIVANMNNVAGKRMAEAIARVGGAAAIPQDKSDKEMVGVIDYMRSRHAMYETPVTIGTETKVHEFYRVLGKRSHDTAIVSDADGNFLGILSKKDVPNGINEDLSIDPFMRRQASGIATAEDGISPLEAIRLMDQSHVHYLPILKGEKVVGVLTKTDAAMRLRYQPNIDDENGGLGAIYTVGALNKDPLDRVRLLLDNGVRNLMLDTAHFDQGKRPYRNIEQINALAAERNVQINLIAGNVVTREAARNILAAGAQYVKVGIGPGAMCTTRMQTGVGRPQVSAIMECADVTHMAGGYVIADGGIQHPRDVAIALAAGADYVMIGSLFAGTHESPPELETDSKGSYKVNYGMASTRASVLRTIGREKRSEKEIFRDIVGHRSEGISEGKVYLKPGLESAALLHHQLLDGAASSATYAGARSLKEFPERAVMGIQTRSGFSEGTAKSSL